MHPVKDYLPILNSYQLSLKNKIHEAGDYYTFIFDTNRALRWKAGQHGIFIMKDRKVKKPYRTFSIASVPSEGQIMISTNINKNPSEFKQALLAFQPGMTITMRGPIGSFDMKKGKPLLFIALSTGITPYRAFLKHLRLHEDPHGSEIQLLYMDRDEAFFYTDELDKAQKSIGLPLHYAADFKSLRELMEPFIVRYHNDGLYYIAGPKSMTRDVERGLKEKGIKRKNIRIDKLIGY